eukprot:scaffold152948_cov17-Prasinocladus_malaysianus.AAC.1
MAAHVIRLMIPDNNYCTANIRRISKPMLHACEREACITPQASQEIMLWFCPNDYVSRAAFGSKQARVRFR